MCEARDVGVVEGTLAEAPAAMFDTFGPDHRMPQMASRVMMPSQRRMSNSSENMLVDTPDDGIHAQGDGTAFKGVVVNVTDGGTGSGSPIDEGGAERGGDIGSQLDPAVGLGVEMDGGVGVAGGRGLGVREADEKEHEEQVDGEHYGENVT